MYFHLHAYILLSKKCDTWNIQDLERHKKEPYHKIIYLCTSDNHAFMQNPLLINWFIISRDVPIFKFESTEKFKQHLLA